MRCRSGRWSLRRHRQVGPLSYVRAPGAPVSVPTLLFNMATVALGELVVCFVLGLPLTYALKKLPQKLFGE